MRPRLSPWSAAIGLLVLLMAAAILGLVPYVQPMDVFWLAVTVFCAWCIKRLLFPEKGN